MAHNSTVLLQAIFALLLFPYSAVDYFHVDTNRKDIEMTKYAVYKYYGIVLIIAFIICLSIDITWQIRVTTIGGIISSAYFIQKHKLDELHLFRVLFRDFNERYGALNEELNRILLSENKLNSKDKDILFNYFNLCGEEYLYYKEGYILPSVWEAWQNGMRIFFQHKQIKELWKEECKTDSYYGLTPYPCFGN